MALKWRGNLEAQQQAERAAAKLKDKRVEAPDLPFEGHEYGWNSTPTPEKPSQRRGNSREKEDA